MTISVPARFFEHLRPFFNSTCSIEQRVAGADSFNAPLETWEAVPGQLPIACLISPVEGGVRFLPWAMPIVGSHRIALAGYYDWITARMRAVANSKIYTIMQVRSDSQFNVTVLSVQVQEL